MSIGRQHVLLEKCDCFTSVFSKIKKSLVPYSEAPNNDCIRWERLTEEGPALICHAKIILWFSHKLFPLVNECRGRQSSPTWLQYLRMRRPGRSQMNFTLNTFWMRMGNLWDQRPSCPSLQVDVPAWGNSWPGWSFSSSSPLSCRSSPLCSLKISPGHERTVTLLLQTVHTHTSCELFQDKCAQLHSETTNTVRNVAELCRSCQVLDIPSLCRCPQLFKVRMWLSILSLA